MKKGFLLVEALIGIMIFITIFILSIKYFKALNVNKTSSSESSLEFQAEYCEALEKFNADKSLLINDSSYSNDNITVTKKKINSNNYYIEISYKNKVIKYFSKREWESLFIDHNRDMEGNGEDY